MLTTQQIIILALIGVLFLITMVIFFKRYKFIYQLGLSIWGIYLIIDALFPAISKLIFHIFFHTISEKSSVFLTSSITLIFEIIIIVWLMFKELKINRKYMYVVLLLFFILWVVELILKSSKMPDGQVYFDRFRVTPITFRIFLTGFILYYYTQLFQNSGFENQFKKPFVWLTIGWLLFYTLTATSYFNEISHSSNQTKDFFLDIQAIAGGMSYIFYTIAFWKTKEWALISQ